MTTNGKGKADLRATMEFVTNVVKSRQLLLDQMFDPRRDVDKECGYPVDVNHSMYQRAYDRMSTATRVVEVLPKETWQVQPQVYEKESPEGEPTPFEQRWLEVSKRLQGKSWFNDTRGAVLWEVLCRADILSGIGRYGVILLGLNDGRPLNQPPPGIEERGSVPIDSRQDTTFRSASGYVFSLNEQGAPLLYTLNIDKQQQSQTQRELLFLRVFSEAQVQIITFEGNPTSPRFGQPLTYRITFELQNDDQYQYVGPNATQLDVHWTRIIHIADNLQSSEVYGTPRMEHVWNNLMDLAKLYGGCAEMYWRGAFPGLSLETQSTLGGDVEVDYDAVKEMMEQYMNGLQRYLSLVGFNAKSLAPQVVDPTPQIRAHIEAICICLGIPVRIFMGSERGEMASSQDDAAWNDRVKHRQAFHATPRIIVPFVNRLIEVGVLPEPESFGVSWPDITSQSDQEKAAVALQRTQAMAQYASGKLALLMTPVDFLSHVIGFEEAEAVAMTEAADAQADDDKYKELIGVAEQARQGEQEMAKMQAQAKLKDSSGKSRETGKGTGKKRADQA